MELSRRDANAILDLARELQIARNQAEEERQTATELVNALYDLLAYTGGSDSPPGHPIHSARLALRRALRTHGITGEG